MSRIIPQRIVSLACSNTEILFALGRESTGGSFPAACREFVIPAEAGIQRLRLDSVSSTE